MGPSLQDFREIALQQLDVADLIHDAAAGIVRQLLGEVGQHFRRDARAQGGEILAPIGGLDIPKQPLEGVEVRRRDLDLCRLPAKERLPTAPIPPAAPIPPDPPPPLSGTCRCGSDISRRDTPA